MSQVVRKLYLGFTQVSKKHMFITNCIQSGVLLGSSDFIAQKYVEKREVWDFRRSLQFVGVGVLFVGPYSSIFFKYLNRFYSTSNKSIYVIVASKVLIDQTFFAPIYTAGMMFVKYEMQGLPFSEIKLEFEDKYLDIIKNNYKAWPFVKIVQYYFIPLHNQVLLAQGFGFLWNIYVTWKINTERKSPN